MPLACWVGRLCGLGGGLVWFVWGRGCLRGGDFALLLREEYLVFSLAGDQGTFISAFLADQLFVLVGIAVSFGDLGATLTESNAALAIVSASICVRVVGNR